MSRQRPPRHQNAGPLALQMGDVTGAVDDLVHGYEQLVHTLPDLTEKIIDVYADTEQMAKQLEVSAHNCNTTLNSIRFLIEQFPLVCFVIASDPVHGRRI